MAIKVIFISELNVTDEQLNIIKTIVTNHMLIFNEVSNVLINNKLTFKESMKYLHEYLKNNTLVIHKPSLYTEIKHMHSKWVKRKYNKQKYISDIQYLVIQPQGISINKENNTLSIKWLCNDIKIINDISNINLNDKTYLTLSYSFTGKVMMKLFVTL